jgi:hypothetical protein
LESTACLLYTISVNSLSYNQVPQLAYGLMNSNTFFTFYNDSTLSSLQIYLNLSYMMMKWFSSRSHPYGGRIIAYDNLISCGVFRPQYVQ